MAYQAPYGPTPWSIGDIFGAIGQGVAGAVQARRQRTQDNFTRIWQTYQGLSPEMQQQMWPYVQQQAKAAGINLPTQFVTAADPQAAQKASLRFQFKMSQLQSNPNLKNDQAFLTGMAADYKDAYGQDAPFVNQITKAAQPEVTASNAPGGAQREDLNTPAQPAETAQVPFFAAGSAATAPYSATNPSTFGAQLQASPQGQQLAQQLQQRGYGFLLNDPITSAADLRDSYSRAQAITSGNIKDDKAALGVAIQGVVAQSANPDPKAAAAAQQKLLELGQKAVDQGLVTPEEFTGIVYNAMNTVNANKQYPVTFPDGTTIMVDASHFASYETAQIKANASLGSVDKTAYRSIEGKFLDASGKFEAAQQQYTDALSKVRSDVDEVRNSAVGQSPRIKAMLQQDPTGMSVLQAVSVLPQFAGFKADLANVSKYNAAMLAAHAEMAPYEQWLKANGGGQQPAAGPGGVPGAAPGPSGVTPPVDSKSGAVLTPQQFVQKARAAGVTVQQLKDSGAWDTLPPEYQQAIGGTGPTGNEPQPGEFPATSEPNSPTAPTDAGGGGTAPAPAPAPKPAPKPAPVPAKKPVKPPSGAFRERARPQDTTGDTSIDAELAAAASPSPTAGTGQEVNPHRINVPMPGNLPNPFGPHLTEVNPHRVVFHGPPPQPKRALNQKQISVLQAKWGKLTPQKRRQLIGRYAIPRALKLVLDHAAGVTTTP